MKIVQVDFNKAEM